MSDTDFPDMGAPLFHFYRTGFENCDKPSIVRDDPEGGDPHIIAMLGHIHDPDCLQELVDAKNREIINGANTPRFSIGQQFTGEGKYGQHIVRTVTDIHRAYNSAGELVSTRYVATHEFCGQIVTERDICETTIARHAVPQVMEAV